MYLKWVKDLNSLRLLMSFQHKHLSSLNPLFNPSATSFGHLRVIIDYENNREAMVVEQKIQ